MSVLVRGENSSSSVELAGIRSVNQEAFGGPEEADLVDRLRADDALISLVAVIDNGESEGRVVGHIMFSRMWIRTSRELVPAVALAPVAVATEYQRSGIGSRLIEQGLEVLRLRGESVVIVLGHPDYYPRFGFSTDLAARIDSPFPREAFMALELRKGALDGVEGVAVYANAFGL